MLKVSVQIILLSPVIVPGMLASKRGGKYIRPVEKIGLYLGLKGGVRVDLGGVRVVLAK